MTRERERDLGWEVVVGEGCRLMLKLKRVGVQTGQVCGPSWRATTVEGSSDLGEVGALTITLIHPFPVGLWRAALSASI